ncbi:MAG: Stp1/IreP family PP2C-type Ser/Thr phosphatase [Pseudomonadota bacterium]
MEIVAHSHTGRVRSNNEDAVAFDRQRGLAVLADGMGGLDAGEVASRIAVERVLGELNGDELSEVALREAVLQANRAVVERARQARVDMGTTVVAWLRADHGQCFVAHVGDSRAYRLRGGTLRRLTTDHSMVQQMIDEGILSEAEALTAPNRNVITRALGLDHAVDVDVRSWVTTPGDLYLLCSDGLTDMVSEPDIETLLGELADRGQNLREVAGALVDRANDSGGHDNVSVMLIRPA